MKKIACVGYHATGAGVIDDLFREFDNVTQGQYEVECRVLQDPDGIADLEYNLVENPHRLNSGFAVKRFQNYVKRMSRTYRKIFGKEWESLSDEYVRSIVKINYRGYWHGDIWLLHPVLRYYHLFRRACSKIAPKKLKKPAHYNYFPWLHTYHAYMEEEAFLERTRDYMDRLCESMNREGKEYVLLDQLYAPGNIGRYVRYMRDAKVIVVDRDPRDVYINQRRAKEHTLPSDPYEFCVAYRDARVKISHAPEEVCMYITFEDMVQRYDEMLPKVMKFVGISPEHHVHKQTRFNPDVSVNNIRQWERYPEYEAAIKIIEQELPEFLYAD
jgi:hypothetical protein